MGFLDTGGNVSIIWLHGDQVGPYMQALHFAFGLGAFVSPMIVGGVISSFAGDPSWAFRVFGLAGFPVSVWLWTIPPTRRKEETGKTFTVGLPEKVVVLLTSIFLFFYVGAEVLNRCFCFECGGICRGLSLHIFCFGKPRR